MFLTMKRDSDGVGEMSAGVPSAMHASNSSGVMAVSSKPGLLMLISVPSPGGYVYAHIAVPSHHVPSLSSAG